MRTTDTLGRRTRTRRQPRGKRIRLRPRDLLWFEKLHQHGPLPTSYLHEFSRHLGGDYARTLKRLADLFHEGGYLDRPRQQFDTIDARYNQLVYDIDVRAETVLRDEGRYSEYAPSAGGLWKHRVMVACITASLELGTLKYPSLRYIPQHRILERADTGLRVPVRYQNPLTERPEKRDLIPDAICGIEYRYRGEARYRFFAIEADRNTEPCRSHRFDRKSYRRTILQYREFIGRGSYKTHYKLRAGMMVLTVTTNDTHMRHLIDLVAELSKSGQNSFMLFQAAPQFGFPFKPPSPLLTLLNRAWQRAGHEPFLIDCV